MDISRRELLYAGIALGEYANPLWTNRVGHVDWRRTFPEVLADVAKADAEPGMEEAEA